MSADRLTHEQLQGLAVDSFDVLNWAKRNGLRKEAQVAELVRTFEVRLGYREANVSISTAPASTGLSFMPLDEAMRVARGGRP